MTSDKQNINRLLVAHRLRDSAGHGMSEAQSLRFREHGFYLDTCLRELVIVPDGDSLSPQLYADPLLEWHRGQSAYSFLLQTATGLNSNVPGETNILGQFRFAWNEWRQRTSARSVYPLQSIMHSLFADCKRIRRDYLHGIGGNSYGSLVRKLLVTASDDRILFVGTGKLARSMTTFFGACELAAWNHKQPRKLTSETKLFAAAEASRAAHWATRIIITSPADDANDELWFTLAAGHRDVVHLGRRRGEPGIWSAWSGSARYFDLDSIFDLRKQQSSVRSLQIIRARNACELVAREHEEDLPFPAMEQRIYA
ncbi:MAG: hypothetical protein P8Y61_12185 [Gammaproteobacteria bacterium]|jgi:hypothetical protein